MVKCKRQTLARIANMLGSERRTHDKWRSCDESFTNKVLSCLYFYIWNHGYITSSLACRRPCANREASANGRQDGRLRRSRPVRTCCNHHVALPQDLSFLHEGKLGCCLFRWRCARRASSPSP